MDLNAEIDQLMRESQTWIPLIMQYGSRVLLALVTLLVGWWFINKLTNQVSNCLLYTSDAADE